MKGIANTIEGDLEKHQIIVMVIIVAAVFILYVGVHTHQASATIPIQVSYTESYTATSVAGLNTGTSSSSSVTTPPSPLLQTNGSAAIPSSSLAQVITSKGYLYDTQALQAFSGFNFYSLVYQTVATLPTDGSSFGYYQLINGVSNTGYWYQLGIDSCSDCSRKFFLGWTLGGPGGNGDLPGNTGYFTGTVNPGDTVELLLYVTPSSVIGTVKDLNTGAYASHTFNKEGSSYFVGSGLNNKDGYFTGPMTEQYSAAPLAGNMNYIYYQEVGNVNIPTSTVVINEVKQTITKVGNNPATESYQGIWHKIAIFNIIYNGAGTYFPGEYYCEPLSARNGFYLAAGYNECYTGLQDYGITSYSTPTTFITGTSSVAPAPLVADPTGAIGYYCNINICPPE